MTTTVVELLRASRCYSPASAQLTENKGGGGEIPRRCAILYVYVSYMADVLYVNMPPCVVYFFIFYFYSRENNNK
jgi:hypothetical protein